LVMASLFLAGSGPQSKLLNPKDLDFSKAAPPTYEVLLETTRGEILMEVRREWSPNGADRFYHLVRHGYYDDAAVFRVRPGVWAQFGIAGNPAIARAWRSSTIPDDPRKESNVRGTVAYAFKDPNGRTTQVFINLQDNRATHDGELFVPFAKVIRGMDVADALYAGYGELSGGGIRAGRQDPLFAGGNAYLKSNFPRLDYISRARVLTE
jgi:cyclophilin family peptidyl-prolyl cis-trans isomerase